jgi:S-DNA-T family DNA segregation ATPase FtsK/SpoIIIE
MPFSSESSYCLPDLTHLDDPPAKPTVIDHEALIASSRVLETKLGTFEVMGKVREIHPGPVITTWPAPGIKSSRVISLADDIARSMSALSARVAVVSGRNAIGIELPNPTREKVYLRELLSSRDYGDTTHRLPLCLGKSIGGESVLVDLARMPHLLIAGTTGSGKSVAINTMILSLLYRLHPDQCRLIMVDPKMLELSVYDGIPHLLVPVITEARAAVTVLNNLVKEMNDRYRVLKDKGVRNLETYNRLVAEEAGLREVIELAEDVPDEDEDEETTAGPAPIVHQHMPRIVVIIDELADLIMTRRCESITMLAQKAPPPASTSWWRRSAVGRRHHRSHQGQLPSRISFKVAGAVNSRTILDAIGAGAYRQRRHAFMPPDVSRSAPAWRHITDAEIKRITDFVRKRAGIPDGPPAGRGGGGDGRARRRRRPTTTCTTTPCASSPSRAGASPRQRRLQVGYNRAARMISAWSGGVVSGGSPRGAGVLAPKRE